MRKLILVISILILSTASVSPQTAIDREVDSLFVIASSGAIQYRDLVQPAIEKLASLGKPIVPRLIEKFKTNSARERITVLNILKKIGKDAVPDLITALNHSSGLVVQRVCWALGDIRDSSAVLPLISVVNHSRWQVRDQALGALGDIRDHQAAPNINNGFNDQIGQVRKSAAVAAGKIKTDIDKTALVGLLGDDFYGARMSAAEALLKLDTNSVMEILKDSVYSENNFVASLSCYILGQIGNDKALEILLGAAQSMDVYLRSHAAVAIIEADPEDNCGYQKKFIHDEQDRLALLKINSALKTTAKNHESQ